MSKSLVIVESPTKAKTIGKFLGKEYEVIASYGHVRDLPGDATEIPLAVKKEKWARLGVNIEEDFAPLYIIPNEKKKRVKELEASLKGATVVYLATDEDREGESISWHLVEVLKPKVPVKRLVFHEITKEAIAEAISSTRDIDTNLVRAQETRRIIDRLFGYSVSPLLWKKMAPGLSAGRVQSVAMRLLVQRERARIRFKEASYHDLKGIFDKLDGGGSVEAELSHVSGKRVALGKDFNPDTGKLIERDDIILLNKVDAEALRDRVQKSAPTVKSIEEKPFTQKPYPPFTTSTLQQEGSRKLSLSARRTMQVAQTLYENGFITYMRTDSTNLSNEAINAARNLIAREFGDNFLPDKPRLYQTKVKNAQEAHEAIRPAGTEFVHPGIVKERLGIEPFKLYELIWKRAIACQMKDAYGTRMSVQIECADATFRAAGKKIEFAGFLRAYVEGSDDPESELADKEKVLPPLKEGEKLRTANIEVLSHVTQPPARYTEGSLIKELEQLGIGRPSTWATIVDVVLSRTYAFKKGPALVPTFLAIAVTGLMERYFENVVDYSFTANLEEDLDAISRGEADYLSYLNSFYNLDRPGLKNLVEKGGETIDPRDVCGVPLGEFEDGKKVEVRIGRYGPFLTDGETRSGLPENMCPDEMTIEKAKEILDVARRGPETLGNHPESGKAIYVKTGRFGPYVQEGETGQGEDKPKMASLLAGMAPEEITLDIAVKLLSLPKTLGVNPENNEEVIAANGRYGPYVKSGSETRSIPDPISPITITYDEAIELLKQPKARGRRASSQPKNLKELGKHPRTELALLIKSGRYGPYVTDGTLNASLPKGSDPAAYTLDEAVSLLEARAAYVAEHGVKKKRGGGGRKKAAKAKEE
jgi:DNA topoisomerase-1